MTGTENGGQDDLAASGNLRRTVNDAIASVQELRAVAYLMDSTDVFGDPPTGARGRAHRSGQLLITLLERELASLEMKLLVIDMLVG
jgi:hypothetical protein